jgi:hypothetical protein
VTENRRFPPEASESTDECTNPALRSPKPPVRCPFCLRLLKYVDDCPICGLPKATAADPAGIPGNTTNERKNEYERG